jgi:hypothetical protein
MNKNEPQKPTSETSTETQPAAHPARAAHPPPSSPQIAAGPLDELPREKKRKKKYSRELKQVQKTHRGLLKAGRRISRAVASGLNKYYERNEKSARKKRDGAVRDAVKNWASGFSRALRKGSGAPDDIATIFDTKPMRRQLKQVARLLTPPYLR